MLESVSLNSIVQRANGSIVYRYDPSPDVVYINATNRCTNHCTFCVKQFTPGLSGYVRLLKKAPATEELWKELQKEIRPTDKQVVWCGFGEPSIRLDLILDLTRRIKEKYSFVKVRLDTDGQAQLRYKSRDVAKELKEAGVDTISISLNAENKEKYDALCNPSYPDAYDGILKFAKDCKKYFIVRMSVVGGTDVDVAKCKTIADEIDCEFVVRG